MTVGPGVYSQFVNGTPVKPVGLLKVITIYISFEQLIFGWVVLTSRLRESGSGWVGTWIFLTRTGFLENPVTNGERNTVSSIIRTWTFTGTTRRVRIGLLSYVRKLSKLYHFLYDFNVECAGNTGAVLSLFIARTQSCTYIREYGVC
jgi:hypothetical protein